MTQGHIDPGTAQAKRAGILICIGAVLSVLLMARHPSVQTHTVADAIAQLQEKATLNAFVHGGLLVVLTAMFVGFLGYAEFLGWQRLRVRGGAVFYGCGVICMIGAALINGFVIPAVASKYDGQPDAVLETLKPMFVLSHSANQALAQAGVVAMSIAMLAWSSAMLAKARILGVMGLLFGALPIAGLLTAQLHLDVRGMGIVILMQAVWNVAVGIWLMRR